ncbi:MAG TPA: dephospho-CoA kinase [Vicinamibacterales bacterium]|nr:dephospho-CoA kinase [Vicinamibacterales bacterium]
MVRAALTGGIATGKSYCLARFAALGAATIDADRLAREAVEPGTPALARIVQRFGASILGPDGALDRAALGRIVFADRAMRADLESIIHPEVYRRINAWFADLPAGTAVAIADIPLLFETGHQHEFDVTIVCVCEPAEQLRRLMARDHLTREAALARLETQWPIAEKAARADIVIRTDAGFAQTDARVQQVYLRLSGA